VIDSGYRTTEVRLGEKEIRRISNLSCKGRDKDRGISKIVMGVQRRFDLLRLREAGISNLGCTGCISAVE
jgi:hypothetical protein